MVLEDFIHLQGSALQACCTIAYFLEHDVEYGCNYIETAHCSASFTRCLRPALLPDGNFHIELHATGTSGADLPPRQAQHCNHTANDGPALDSASSCEQQH